MAKIAAMEKSAESGYANIAAIEKSVESGYCNARSYYEKD